MFCFAVSVANLCLSTQLHKSKEFMYLFIFLQSLKSLAVSIQFLYFFPGKKNKQQTTNI